MLTCLDIKNVVLIDRLTLDGETGLSALTGETGAGKSILLDALGLALGGRADAGLVRHGADQLSVTASFDLSAEHPVFKLLADKDISAHNNIVLRRTVGRDGRSKAFINDTPVTVQLMRDIGAFLVEIHGQFETQGLLNPDTHRMTLDSFAGMTPDVIKLQHIWQDWSAARNAYTTALNDMDSLRRQEDYLRHAVSELEKLSPQRGEEEILAQKRQMLRLHEKMQSSFDEAAALIEKDDGLQNMIGRLENLFSRLSGEEGSAFNDLRAAISRARSEIEDIGWQIDRLKNGDRSSENLVSIEERYFALRECAKKHRCACDDLPDITRDLSQKLKLITHQDDALAELEKKIHVLRSTYLSQAQIISHKRIKAAEKLAKKVNIELPDLKLDKARFDVECKTMTEDKDFSAHGIDRIQFVVSTNPQTPAGPLHKIASGGELSRFMLALKVILAETGSVPTLIFDEADSGIGGATADAVGERLQRLAAKYQVLAVTHSPQVAARAKHHWHVAKTDQKGTVITKITPLAATKDRQEEIARLLSGAKVTAEARAQAAKLLENNAA